MNYFEGIERGVEFYIEIYKKNILNVEIVRYKYKIIKIIVYWWDSVKY